MSGTGIYEGLPTGKEARENVLRLMASPGQQKYEREARYIRDAILHLYVSGKTELYTNVNILALDPRIVMDIHRLGYMPGSVGNRLCIHVRMTSCPDQSDIAAALPAGGPPTP